MKTFYATTAEAENLIRAVIEILAEKHGCSIYAAYYHVCNNMEPFASEFLDIVGESGKALEIAKHG